MARPLAVAVRACRVEGLEFYDALPASAAVCAGNLVFVAGQFDADAHGGVRSPGDVAAQTSGAFDCLERALEACGGGLGDVVDIMSFHRDTYCRCRTGSVRAVSRIPDPGSDGSGSRAHHEAQRRVHRPRVHRENDRPCTGQWHPHVLRSARAHRWRSAGAASWRRVDDRRDVRKGAADIRTQPAGDRRSRNRGTAAPPIVIGPSGSMRRQTTWPGRFGTSAWSGRTSSASVTGRVLVCRWPSVIRSWCEGWCLRRQ